MPQTYMLKDIKDFLKLCIRIIHIDKEERDKFVLFFFSLLY